MASPSENDADPSSSMDSKSLPSNAHNALALVPLALGMLFHWTRPPPPPMKRPSVGCDKEGNIKPCINGEVSSTTPKTSATPCLLLGILKDNMILACLDKTISWKAEVNKYQKRPKSMVVISSITGQVVGVST
mmetsp:Transcript_25902/g.46929  ORF Transcript_25902/g.46929 Transcript_25902/m.46929 type:complete len:133 (+) Transcript_25902:944-1342(+)